jgi:hypothetical protein
MRTFASTFSVLKKKSKILLHTSPFVGIALFLLIFFEVKVPHSISTYFEVQPVKRWILAKGPEGQIVSSIVDFASATSNDYAVVQFERGESMNFRLAQTVLPKSSIVKGDTVGVITSSRLQERLTQLAGSLLIARADLTARSTGEKQALVEEARNRVKFAEAKIQEKMLLFERAKELFNKEYISKEEYEASLWNLKQAEIEHEINKAQLEALMTGSKSEELQVLKSTIDSYRNEMRLLNNRLKDFVLTAPISGEIIRQCSRDTLLLVNDMSQLILSAPIRYENVHYLAEREPVSIELKNISEELTGKLISISKEVKNLNGIQVLYSRILLDSSKTTLVPGLLIGGEIILPKVTIKEYLFSLFES